MGTSQNDHSYSEPQKRGQKNHYSDSRGNVQQNNHRLNAIASTGNNVGHGGVNPNASTASSSTADAYNNYNSM